MEEDAIKMENSHISEGIRKGLEEGLEKGIQKGIEQGSYYNVPISMDI